MNMKTTQIFIFCLAVLLSFWGKESRATQLSGTYTIDSTQAATATNFRNLNSAFIYMTSAGARTDGGPSNSAPFGVSGPVVFEFAGSILIHDDQVEIPVIPGVSSTNTVRVAGKGHTIQYNCNVTLRHVIRFTGANWVTLDSLTIKTTNATYGWGIHFWTNANNNQVRNCTIDISAVTSTSSVNSVGICFTNSTTSVTTAGANGANNLFTDNTILGHPTTGGPYYAVTLLPQSSSATASNNKFIRNVIQNFFYNGFYLSNTNGTLLKDNIISNPTRTSTTTIYAISLWNGNRSDSIIGNKISLPFGASSTTTNTAYGIALFTPNTQTTGPGICANNQIFDFRGNGTLYGIYSSVGNNWRFYHNTISFDQANSTVSSSYQTYGFYHSGSPSGLGIDFRNNIVSIKRGGSSVVYNVYLANAGTLFNFNNNVYYKQGPGSNVGYYNGLNYPTFASWRTANAGAFDSNSVYTDPGFVSPSTGNFTPTDGFINNKGANLTATVPTDINGVPRSTTPDPGILEFTPPASTDAGVAEVVVPPAPLLPGAVPVNVKIRNSGTTTLTSVQINWTVNGVAQTPFAWTGSLAGGSQSANVNIGNFTLTSLTGFNIAAWTSSPNSGADARIDNDSAYAENIYAVVPGGSYTINKNAPGSATNFPSFTSFSNAVTFGGIAGPISCSVVQGSGPYNEQVFFGNIPGISAISSIFINGNNEEVQFNNTNPGSIGIINLIGTDYITFKNLRVRSLNVSYGVGFILTAGSDFNTIDSCFIDISVTTGSGSAGIALTGTTSTSLTTTGINGSFNTFSNNMITGGSNGGPYYGLIVIPTNINGSANNTTRVINNTIRDFTVYGMYIMYSAGGVYRGNVMSRPTKASPTTHYGIYMSSGMAQDTFDRNVVRQPFEMLQTSTGTFYAYYAIATNIPAARPVIFSNNMMYNIRFNGTLYGFYQLSAQNFRLWNNTFVVDHPTSTSTAVTYLYYNSGTPTTTTIRNNIFYLNRGGTGNKYALYFATTGAGYVCNNNAFFMGNAGTNTFLGYYSTNQLDLNAWKLVNSSAYDQNSVQANPRFRSYINPDFYQPGADSLNNIGFATPDVQFDFTGQPRSTTPDIGSYEFTVPPVDAGLTRFTGPLNPISLGLNDINVVVKNFGTSALYSADLNWSVNGVTQTPTGWSGNLAAEDTAVATAGTFNFINPGFYNIKAWTSNPNIQTDSFNLNDTIVTTVCTPLSDTIRVNPALPAGNGNFTSIRAAVNSINTCGVTGSLTVLVSPGVYNEQLTFLGLIPGLNAGNKIYIVGSDSATTRIVHDGSISRATVLINGTRNLEFRNIGIESTNPSAGYGVLMMNAADSNSFVKVNVKVAVLSTAVSTVAGIVSSASNINLNNAGNNANYIRIDSCTVLGGYYGIDLYNATATKAVGNSITNSRILNAYYYPVYAYFQNGIIIDKNQILNTGNGVNTFSAGIYVLSSDNGIRITKNQILGQLGGYGIYLSANLGTAQNHNLIANNMIQLGAATYTSYGIYDPGNLYTDYLFNAVHNTSGDGSYASTAMYYSYSSASYGYLVIKNNIFSSSAGATAIWCANNTIIGTLNVQVDNNVYYSTASYQYRLVNNIFNSLLAYRTTLNLTMLTNPDSLSIFADPNFFSATNLRTINPVVDSIGVPFASVPDDIDGNTRSLLGPDPGVYEFAKPAEDAGVVAILAPAKPALAGMTDVAVVIRNFGTNTLTSCNVSYQVDTLIRTLSYSGTLLPGEIDTVVFDTSSGLGGTSQRYFFNGNFTTIKAYTTSPNSVPDLQKLNDTATFSFCGALSGVYTINPTGTGTSNFVSIQAALDKLNCGGVVGPVTFNIAPGTYTTQMDITNIAGASVANMIEFRSATGVASSVIITSSNSGANNNYTLRLLGAQGLKFTGITFRNTNTTYGRVVSINKLSAQNINTSDVEFRNCVLEGLNNQSTSDLFSIVFGPTGDNATNLKFVNNQFRYGSYGIFVGGQNIIAQFSNALVLDSNTFFQNYWASIYLTNRNNSKIRNNFIDGHPNYGYYGIFLSSVSNETEVISNNIQSYNGYYGIYLATNNYYGELGFARIQNNVVNMMSVNTQYGIYLVNASRASFIGNTVRCQATTTTYAFYFSGNTTSTTTPQVVASNNIRLVNNILFSANSYALYLANVQAQQGMSQVDNNLYFSGTANFGFVSGINYTGAAFYTNFRRQAISIPNQSDSRSLFAPVTFTSVTNCKPLESSVNAWNVNGRAQQIFDVTKDIVGLNRSSQVITGAPDIGAYEITPTSLPVLCTITDSIAAGATQRIVDNGDTVAVITWGTSGTLPSSITPRYFPGGLISDPTNNGNNTGADYMDVYWRIEANGGSFYTYDLTLRYDPNMMGKVVNKSDVKLAKKQTGVNGTWVHFGSTFTTVDTVLNTFGTTFLTDFSDFTGTTDFAPLPVVLSRFDAARRAEDADLSWTTSSEINSRSFEIERSLDGENFEYVGSVKAAGNSQVRNSYKFTDINAAQISNFGMAYYRLKIVDLDGSYEYSKVKAVDFGKDREGMELEVYPNPFNEGFTMKISSTTDAAASYELIDLSGRSWSSGVVQVKDADNLIDVSALNQAPAGIYFLRVNLGDQVLVKKLVRQ